MNPRLLGDRVNDDRREFLCIATTTICAVGPGRIGSAYVQAQSRGDSPVQTAPRYDAVLFDLLSALLDSGSLWNSIAGSEEAGGRWLSTFLRMTYENRAYRPYLELAGEAAKAVGLDRSLAHTLGVRYHELQPWPDVVPVLSRLSAAGLQLAVVTNCSCQLGQVAAKQVGIKFASVITAEDAGWYKPDPRPYRMALNTLGFAADHSLFVAGSAYDLPGTAEVGLPTFWHDRKGSTLPDHFPPPLVHERTLSALPGVCGIG